MFKPAVVFGLTTFILFFACQSTVDVDLAKEKKLVVEAYLRSQDSIRISVQSSANLTEDIQNKINNLDIFILYENQKIKLNYTGYTSFGSYYSAPADVFIIPDFGQIRFEANYKGKRITSETNIPVKTSITSFKLDYYRDNNNALKIRSIDVYADFPVQKTLYLIEIELKQSILYNNKILDFSSFIFRQYAGTNQTSNFIHAENGEVGGSSQSLDPHDEYLILHLYSLTSFHQEFYKAIQSQQNDGDGLGSIFGNNVTEVPTNIENGYGIFTTMNSDTMRMEIE